MTDSFDPWRSIRPITFAAAAALAAILSPPVGAAAKPSLTEVRLVDDGLFAIAVAEKLQSACPTLSGRVFKAVTQMQALADHARGLGYSDAEIRSYIDDEVARARMKARRDAYLAARGVEETRPETYCTLGHSEIAAKSAIGALLRAK